MKSDISPIIEKFLHASRRALKGNVVAEYLFGSYATQTQTPLSDIDILIIVESLTPEMQTQMSGLASEYALTYDICLSPILTDTDIWEKNKRNNTLFYQEIIRNGIRL